METNASRILTVNAGSSSVKFALFDTNESPKKIYDANIAGASSASAIIQELGEYLDSHKLAAVGHRVVNGGPEYYAPAIVDEKMLKVLRALKSFDPEHLPEEVRLIEEFRALYPDVPQIACFDTAFHHDMPRVAQLLPIPRRYEKQGIRRYGFHGLSYTYLMKELARVYGEAVSRGRVILAHLGSGASIAAVKGGKPIDTSMGFTPASGVPMSTRSGDLDPGLVWYLASEDKMDMKKFNEMVTNESGLLGVSETSADMLTLLNNEITDMRASEAVELFCYQVKKYVGAYSAALGGMDTLVFTGGMGENAPKIRGRICDGLEFLGIEIDESKNNANAGTISKDGSRVSVFVIHTDEGAIIASEAKRALK